MQKLISDLYFDIDQLTLQQLHKYQHLLAGTRVCVPRSCAEIGAMLL